MATPNQMNTPDEQAVRTVTNQIYNGLNAIGLGSVATKLNYSTGSI